MSFRAARRIMLTRPGGSASGLMTRTLVASSARERTPERPPVPPPPRTARYAVEAEFRRSQSYGGRRIGFVPDEERSELVAQERRLLELATTRRREEALMAI